jgi:hypothetical protein
MFEEKFISNAINRSAETGLDRRKLFGMVGIAGAGAAAAAIASSAPADAATAPVSDASILNFALNLEYLEAEFYLNAVTGKGLPAGLITGKQTTGAVTGGGHAVPFKTAAIKNYAVEIAQDEKAHVSFLRAALGSAAVARPAINIGTAFQAAAIAAGVATASAPFDPYANETNFLLAAFIFEDVGVTAYKGAAGLIANKTYLEAAAGILAVEAYHAGIIRSTLYAQGIAAPQAGIFSTVDKISGLRDAVDGSIDDDQGIGNATVGNLVPTDANSIAYSRAPGEVLNIVYLNATGKSVSKGGFFTNGLNGALVASTANG